MMKAAQVRRRKSKKRGNRLQSDVYVKLRRTKSLGYLLNKTFQGQRGQGESSEVGMREGRERKAVIQMKSKKMPNVEKELQCSRVPGWAWVRAGVNKPTA